MTIFTKSKEPTEEQLGADAGIVTAHIDVNRPGDFWTAQIQVHGNSVEDAEQLRDEVLAALVLRDAIKEALK